MKHDIIKTDDYLLVVDESEIKGWYYDAYINKVKHSGGAEYGESIITRNIIAHLPLNGSPILEGVDLLPPLGDNVQKLVREHFELDKELNNPSSFKSGYNKAKEKYKYTEEDMRKAWNTAYIDAMSIDEETYKPLFFEDFIQSLSQPKMPIGFERELVNIMGKGEPITERNSQGHIQWNRI